MELISQDDEKISLFWLIYYVWEGRVFPQSGIILFENGVKS